MRDHSHFSPENTGYCEHCGQPLPVQGVLSYGKRRVNRLGLAITVLLHVLLVLVWVLQPHPNKTAPPPAGGAMVYIAPLAGKPQPKPSAPARKKTKPSKQERVKIERLPDTITLPNEKPVQVTEVEPPKPEIKPLPPEMDMAAAIEARRRARGEARTETQGETENERGTRIALANIAAANGRSKGDDKNETGGIFEVKKTSLSATLKFRGWNPNFKRRWLQEVTVELGNEKDIETAIVKKMIEIIRKEKTGDFDWDSHRLQRVVKMSARVEDTAELHAFLMKEMFSDDERGRPARR